MKALRRGASETEARGVGGSNRRRNNFPTSEVFVGSGVTLSLQFTWQEEEEEEERGEHNRKKNKKKKKKKKKKKEKKEKKKKNEEEEEEEKKQ